MSIQRYFPYLRMFKANDEELIKQHHTDVYVKYDDINKIKAEGIREMTRHFMYEVYKGEEILAYADKLEDSNGI